MRYGACAPASMMGYPATLLLLPCIWMLGSCSSAASPSYSMELDQKNACATYNEAFNAELDKAIKGLTSSNSLDTIYSMRPNEPTGVCEIEPRTIYAIQVSPRPEDYDQAVLRLASISYRNRLLSEQCQGAESQNICETQKGIHWDQTNYSPRPPDNFVHNFQQHAASLYGRNNISLKEALFQPAQYAAFIRLISTTFFRAGHFTPDPTVQVRIIE